MKVFLDRDNSGHWFTVPVAMRQVWEDWREIDEDDPRAWEAPEGCVMIGRHPSTIEFVLEND